ncbi:MAG: hypothetical protein J3Q66DRAFT_434974 [Benniella sp.]|nr:MAG: hypothetical protein J3Q66DRAFT_434974 [Benniella sp.]
MDMNRHAKEVGAKEQSIVEAKLPLNPMELVLFLHQHSQPTTHQVDPIPQDLPKQAKTRALTMPFFKSNKNKIASAASTPGQTPRSSMQALRPVKAAPMTREQALEIIMQKSVGNVGPSLSVL